MKDFYSEKNNPDKTVRKQSIEETSKTTSSASANIGQIPTSWNETNRDYPLDKCVQDLFEEQMEKIPDAVAVIYQTQQLTYRQLNERANQLAHYLRRQGVKPDTLVGVCLAQLLNLPTTHPKPQLHGQVRRRTG